MRRSSGLQPLQASLLGNGRTTSFCPVDLASRVGPWEAPEYWPPFKIPSGFSIDIYLLGTNEGPERPVASIAEEREGTQPTLLLLESWAPSPMH